MKKCSEGHIEIVWDENDKSWCPLCDKIDQLDNANDDLDRVRDDYEVAQERIKELEQQLSGEPEPPERNEDDPGKER